jgi:hypothetical protein
LLLKQPLKPYWVKSWLSYEQPNLTLYLIK